MKHFALAILVFSLKSYSQNIIASPATFKGEHYALYNKCLSPITFCEITQQTYTSCGSVKNCYGLYVLPGDTFYVNIEDKNQAEIISADISFGGYFPAISNVIFQPINNNCVPQQALQIVIPLNSVLSSSFQIVAQNTMYVNTPSLTPGVPEPFNIYVGGQQPPFTFSLSNFTICPIYDDVSVVQNDNLKDVIFICPNPTNGLLIINSRHDFEKIELLSITGQVLLLEQTNSKTHQLQLQNFAEGVYFVRITYPNGLSRTKKVVRN